MRTIHRVVLLTSTAEIDATLARPPRRARKTFANISWFRESMRGDWPARRIKRLTRASTLAVLAFLSGTSCMGRATLTHVAPYAPKFHPDVSFPIALGVVGSVDLVPGWPVAIPNAVVDSAVHAALRDSLQLDLRKPTEPSPYQLMATFDHNQEGTGFDPRIRLRAVWRADSRSTKVPVWCVSYETRESYAPFGLGKGRVSRAAGIALSRAIAVAADSLAAHVQTWPAVEAALLDATSAWRTTRQPEALLRALLHMSTCGEFGSVTIEGVLAHRVRSVSTSIPWRHAELLQQLNEPIARNPLFDGSEFWLYLEVMTPKSWTLHGCGVDRPEA